VVHTDARDALRAHLDARGVATGIHYPVPIHRSDAYADLGLGPGSLPAVERLSEQICSLPIFPGLSDEEIAWIATSVAELDPLPAKAAA
jgi:dTDP-4-amino-4,6-dideoxygalactose transaminase